MALIDLSKQVALGVDIGGTNSKFGLVNHRGEILDKGSIKTDEYEKVEDFIDALYEKVSPLIKKHFNEKQFDGIGVGAPNANYFRGTIEQAMKRLKEEIISRNLNTKIEVDGGVGRQNAEVILQAGADILIAGNAIFGAEHPTEEIKHLKSVSVHTYI